MGRDEAAAAAAIWSAWEKGEPLKALPPELSPETEGQAWAIQRRLDGFAGPRVGWKLAATSTAGQKHIGVDAPLIGALYEGAIVPSGAEVAPTGIMIVEAEFAFRIGTDLAAPDGRAHVMAAIADLLPAIEVPDSRFEEYESVGGLMLTAEAVASHKAIVGGAAYSWEASHLPELEVVVSLNGKEASRGSGANVLGDPLEALIWLARELAGRGEMLKAGDIVMTGAAAPPIEIQPGDFVHADFGTAGVVDVTFSS